MLVLTRRVGESIFIGDDIEVMILAAEASVKIGISAPREIGIVRTELIAEAEFEHASDP